MNLLQTLAGRPRRRWTWPTPAPSTHRHGLAMQRARAPIEEVARLGAVHQYCGDMVVEDSSSGGGGGGGGGPHGAFFHGSINKAKADELLLADGGAANSGKFLIRSKGDSASLFILSVVYKGKATHHNLVLEDGEFTLNKAPTGQSTVPDVIEHYREKRPKWPVPLTDGVEGL